MALRKTLKFQKQFFAGELFIANAYWKITRINGNKSEVEVEVSVVVDEKSVHTEFHRFVPDMSGNNFIAQAYEYLKTLPEFADATNC